ncbi:HAD family hydrolase [Floccifex sp.]|uniref:HAD family hydrolase n=1 Tax=Floccifex sp. TaxID=2815810 RepID=UPI003EFF05E1
MLKYIVMDMDGTLLNSQNQIPPKTKELLIEYQKEGVQLILASGRSFHRLMPIAQELQMFDYGGYFIEIDGIGYYDLKKDEHIVLKSMDTAYIKELVETLISLDCEVQVCQEQTIYAHIPNRLISIKEKLRKEQNVADDFPWTSGPWDYLFDMRKAYQNIYYFDDINEISGESLKVQVMDCEEKIEEVFSKMKPFSSQFEFFRTSHRQIEILPYGYSKGMTLKYIMDKNNAQRDEVIAFGDGENDVSLFAQVDHSIAMGQARDYVKKQARFVTKSNDEEGIYYALKKG